MIEFRPVGQPKREWSIQALRFFAAALVVIYHGINSATNGDLPPGIVTRVVSPDVGRCGVDIFFVISGFVIATSARGTTSTAFAAKRLQRILPLYWMIAAAWTVLVLLAGKLTWRGLIATAALWPVTDRITAPFYPVAWTLCFEMLFYAAVSVALIRPRVGWVVLAAYAAALALRTSSPLMAYLGNPLSMEFLLGMLLARMPRRTWLVAALPLGAALLGAEANFHWCPRETDAGFLAGAGCWVRFASMGLPAGLVVLGTLQLRVAPGVLTRLGDSSYALYLVHVPIVKTTVVLFRALGAPTDLSILVSFVISTVLAWRIYEIVEKPILRWLGGVRSVGAQRQHVAAPPASSPAPATLDARPPAGHAGVPPAGRRGTH